MLAEAEAAVEVLSTVVEVSTNVVRHYKGVEWAEAASGQASTSLTITAAVEIVEMTGTMLARTTIMATTIEIAVVEVI